jgi:hypothetical protein
LFRTDFAKKIFFLIPLFYFFVSGFLSAQESLKSIEEEYYNFLALRGLTERPYLNYRTLSDSEWAVDENSPHPWENQKLGIKRLISNKLLLRVYGPDFFTSFNTAAPYGQNDGALWQGKGLNVSLSGGIRLEGYGLELTFKPQLALSQNLPFEIMPSAYESQYGYFWGYAQNIGADAPQRFGENPFYVFDWGDSEIRYTWKNLTVGFGAQAIWLGPSQVNSILHSNNAPTYPKLDIGLRKQPVTIPWLNWYLGDVEARLWLGRLTESNYFDSDPSNDHTMFHGLSLAYAPSFLPGLTLFANRVCLVDWDWQNIKYIIPKEKNTVEDQKASFGASWTLPQAGIEVYGELGVDDFVPDGGNGKFGGYIRYPFHTMVYTVGLKKTIPVLPARNIHGALLFEWNMMEMSQDFQFQWPYSFYFHHNAIHGYTNRGQWIGAGSGGGGNSQYLAFRLYYPKGTSSFFVHRNNPDNNFVYTKTIFASAAGGELEKQYFTSWKANWIMGVDTSYFLSDVFNLSGGFAYDFIVNPYYYYTKTSEWKDELMYNFSLNLAVQLLL